MHVSFLPLTVCFGFFCLTSQLFNWFCGEFHWTEVIVLLWKDSNAKNIMNISIKISGIRNFQHLKNTTSYWNKCTLSHIGSKQTAVLTDAGDEVIKPVLGKQRILQTPEVELQHASHRVDVVVALLINQRVITWTREDKRVKHILPHLQVILQSTSYLSRRSSWYRWPPPVTLTPEICLDAGDLSGAQPVWSSSGFNSLW